LIIRRPLLSDIPDIFACHEAAVFGKAHTHYGIEILKAWSPGASPDRIQFAEKEMEDEQIVFFVAELANTIEGFGIAIPKLNEFRALYVRPGTMKGIGRIICEAILKDSKIAACSYLDFDSSLNAVGFYKKMGAREIDTTNHVFGGGISMPAVKMRFEM
jgi:hypothetical protein